jgi:3'-5' exoribonuclease
VGGLLEHTVAVVTILLTVHDLHPELDLDLLITAGLLHDLGKLQELALGAAIEYTDRGRLLGHIVLTDRAVRARIEQIPEFPQELDDQLNHILLSHHGQKEYGAPIVPMTPEACALHYADNLDAHVQYFQRAVEQGQASGNSWTEYQRLFDRYLYIGPRGRTQEVAGEDLASDDDSG